jgi:hypothetical protein
MSPNKKAVIVMTPPAPCRKDTSDEYKKHVALTGLDTIRTVIAGHMRVILDSEGTINCPDVGYVDVIEAAVRADWKGQDTMPGLTAIIYMLSHADDLCSVAEAPSTTQELVAVTVDRIRKLYETGYAVPGPNLNDVVARVAISVATAMESLFVRTCLKVNEDSDPRIVFDIDRDNVNAYSEGIVTTWIQESLFADVESPYLTVPFGNAKDRRVMQKKVRTMIQGIRDTSSPERIVNDVSRYLRSLTKVKTICVDGHSLTGRHVVAMRDDLMEYLGTTARQVLTTDGTVNVLKTLHEQLDRACPVEE